MSAEKHYVLTLQCEDTKGVVAAVSGYLARNDTSIVESSQFNDAGGNRVYMRTVFRQDGPDMPPLEMLRDGFTPIAHRFKMSWQLRDASVKPRILIAVSKAGHCLYDLLHRWRAGQLAVDIPAVISNHDDMRSFVEWSGIPYHHLPVTPETRSQQEARFLELVHELRIDLAVLARYMQILSPALCTALSGRCINIHHSFLPSFKGAKPYAQAYARGVKIIGATAHYITSDLDEGPIIEQGIERVSHAHTPAALERIGRDIECTVLTRAVSWHIEQRVLLNVHKTVVFA